MLIIGRQVGQKLHIGDDIVITIVEKHGSQVKIGIEAPDHIRITREEHFPSTTYPIQANAAQLAEAEFRKDNIYAGFGDFLKGLPPTKNSDIEEEEHIPTPAQIAEDEFRKDNVYSENVEAKRFEKTLEDMSLERMEGYHASDCNGIVGGTCTCK